MFRGSWNTITGTRNRRIFVILAFVLLILSTGIAYAGVANDNTRVFYADDDDPRHDQYPDFGYIDLAFLSEDESPADLAKGYDFYYYSTKPEEEIPPMNVTLNEYRANQLEGVNRVSNTSWWPNTAPSREDGTYVKDAYISFMGVDGGAQYQGTGSDLHGTYLIDRDGAVLNMLDFRTEVPTGDCTLDLDYQLINGTREIVGGTRRCISYSISDTTVRRSVSIGEEDWTVVGDERRIEYRGADVEDRTTLTVEATIGVEITKRIDRDRYNNSTGWVDATEASDLIESGVTVSDSRPALVTPNQQLSFDQRVISISEEKKAIVLTINGPADLHERQMWNRALFATGQDLLNVWGVYSTRQYYGGKSIGNSEDSPRPSHFPHILDTIITSRAEEPTPRTGGDRDFESLTVPELVEYDRHAVGQTNATLPDDVRLHTAKPYTYQRIVLKNAPSQVTEIKDIHGNSIPVDTTIESFHQTEIEATELDEDRLQLRLVDASTGEPASGRKLLLEGADQGTVTTDTNGEAVVNPSRMYVQVRFAGDNWRSKRPLYLGESSRSVYTGNQPDFVGGITKIVNVLPHVALLIILSIVIGRSRLRL